MAKRGSMEPAGALVSEKAETIIQDERDTK